MVFCGRGVAESTATATAAPMVETETVAAAVAARQPSAVGALAFIAFVAAAAVASSAALKASAEVMSPPVFVVIPCRYGSAAVFQPIRAASQPL